MDFRILSLIIIFVIITIFVSVIMYVIFDNTSSDRRIGNEITIMVEIMVGIFIAIIIQYNHHNNQKRIDIEKEQQRKSIFSILYGIALLMPLPLISILKDWENIQKLESVERNEKIWNAVKETNSEYYRFRKLVDANSNLIDPTIRISFDTTERIYNDYFLIIKTDPSDKKYLEKLIDHYQICVTIIPHKYHDEKIRQKIIEFMRKEDESFE